MNTISALELSSSFKETLGRLVYTHSPLLIGLTGLTVVLALAWIVWRANAAKRLQSVGQHILPILAWTFVAATLSLIVLHGLYPAFISFLELPNACVSYLLLKGFPLYHSADSPERYSLLYGPITYLLTEGCYRAFGVSIFTAKLPNTTFLLAMCATTACILCRWVSAPAIALAAFLLVLDYEILTCAPLIILCAIVAHSLYYFSTWRFRTLVVGICLGLACDAKLHSGLYFLPILFDLLQQRKLSGLVVIGTTSMAAMGLPFLIPGIDWHNYLFWLHAAAAHGLSLHVFLDNLDWLAYQLSLVLGVFLLLTLRGDAMDGEKWFAMRFSVASRLGAAAATLSVLVVASKPGAGFHHFFPLLPAFVILVAPYAHSLNARAENAGCCLELRALTLVYLSGMLAFGFLPIARTYYDILRVRAFAMGRDLQEISRQNPGAHIALGDAETVPGEILSKPAAQGRTVEPLLLFAGHPYLYDSLALMDMQKSGLPISTPTIDRLRDGSIDLWLFPKGRTAFNVMNLYDLKTPLFPPPFREAFFANYGYQGTSEFYDIWKFRRQTTPENSFEFSLDPRR